MNEKNYLRLVRGFSIFDLLILGPFALPFLATFQLSTFSTLHTSLNLSGSNFPVFESTHLLFLNLLGTVTIFWSIWRFRHASVEIGIFEGWARLSFAALMLYHLIVGNISAVAWVFVGTEIVSGVLHLLGYSLKREG